MTNRQVDNKIKKLSELEAQKKDLEKAIGAIKDEIKFGMGDEIEINTGKYIVKNTPYNTSKFDSKSFKESHQRLYKQFLKVTTSTRFSYKEI